MTKTLFTGQRTSKNKTWRYLKALCFFIFITLCCSSYSHAFSNHPTWFKEAIDKADQLNNKNPVLALEFTQDILKKNKGILSSPAKAAIYSRLAKYHYYLGNIEESLNRINQFYALSPDLTTHDSIGVLLTHGGVLDEQGKTKQAMALYLRAEGLAKTANNRKLLAESYGFIANSFSSNQNDSQALKYYHKAYLNIKSLGDELEMAYLKIQMASSYSYLYDYEKAVELAKEAINYFNQQNYYFDEFFAQSTLAKIYMIKKEYDNAILGYKRVIELSPKVEKESLIAIAYLGLAKAYSYKKEINKARDYFKLYKQFPSASNTPFSKVEEYTLNAEIAFVEKNIPLTKSSIKQAELILSTLNKQSMLTWHISILNLNADIAVFEKNYQNAYQLQKKAHKLFKSYQNNLREKLRSKYKIMFDTDQALLQNQLLERDKQLDKASLENAVQQQNLQVIIISIISLLALMLAFFISRQLKTSKTLHRLANTDVLTELANRRFTFTQAKRMFSLAKDNEQHFTTIIFDIDHFKQVNDNYGHAGGDIALKEISAIANNYVRDNDTLGRIGGEEFLLILPNTSATQAMEVAERMRVAIEQKDIMIIDKAVRISASFGVAQLNKNQQNFNQLFNQADAALYQAKNSGRNLVVLAK